MSRFATACVALALGVCAHASQDPRVFVSHPFQGGQTPSQLYYVDPVEGGGDFVGWVGFVSLSDIVTAADGSVIYGSLGYHGGGAIIAIDPDTGLGSFLMDTPYDAVPALELAPDGTLYGVGRFQGANGVGDLITIDLEGGTVTTVGPLTELYVASLAFDPTGTLYGVAYVDNQYTALVRVDPATGDTTVVGPTGMGFVAGLTYHPNLNTLVGVISGFGGGLNAEPGDVVLISRATGVASLLFPTFINGLSGVTLATPRLLGDVNGDGTVNIVDFIQLMSAWGTTCQEPPAACNADLNCDGIVNVQDLLLLLTALG